MQFKFQLVMLYISKTNNGNKRLFWEEKLGTVINSAVKCMEKAQTSTIASIWEMSLYKTHHSEKTQLHFPDNFPSCHFFFLDLAYTVHVSNLH
jgi:hypothetical protein